MEILDQKLWGPVAVEFLPVVQPGQFGVEFCFGLIRAANILADERQMPTAAFNAVFQVPHEPVMVKSIASAFRHKPITR